VKTLILAASVVALACSGAHAQSSQSQSAAQAGTNGNHSTTKHGAKGRTTIGIGPGAERGRTNEALSKPSTSPTGPAGQGSKTAPIVR
jgi:opacity protein-like surface antigen